MAKIKKLSELQKTKIELETARKEIVHVQEKLDSSDGLIERIKNLLSGPSIKRNYYDRDEASLSREGVLAAIRSLQERLAITETQRVGGEAMEAKLTEILRWHCNPNTAIQQRHDENPDSKSHPHLHIL